jgi:hypothetical protein
MNHNKDRDCEEREMQPGRSFLVTAPSVNAVRRALHRAPGGVRVLGRHDRETIVCSHTMDEHSFVRSWPVILSRLEKAGLKIVRTRETGSDRPTSEAPGSADPRGD